MGHLVGFHTLSYNDSVSLGAVKRLHEGHISLYDFETVMFCEFLDGLGDSQPKHYPARFCSVHKICMLRVHGTEWNYAMTSLSSFQMCRPSMICRGALLLDAHTKMV